MVRIGSRLMVVEAPTGRVQTWLDGRSPGWWVVPLTIAMVIVFVGSGWSVSGIETDRLLLEVTLVAANTLPLLAIRRNPLLVLAIFAVAYPTWVALDFPAHQLQSLPSIAAMFAVGAWDRPLWIRSFGLLAPGWMILGGLFSAWDVQILELTFIAVFFVVVWALGVLIADRRARELALESRTRELERARQELAERAVADERARIARELHDVIAHAMSVITVQAGVGAHLAEGRSDPAVEALSVIETTGRGALEEMRRMLTMLREDDTVGTGHNPQPTLGDLPELIDQVRQAGVHVVLTTKGALREMSPGFELTVYRIVQEALTNVIKHAPRSTAGVTVTYEPGSLTVEIVNSLGVSAGHADGEPAVGEGLGLRGMAERASLYGGRVDIAAENNHFRVKAWFPLEDDGS